MLLSKTGDIFLTSLEFIFLRFSFYSFIFLRNQTKLYVVIRNQCFHGKHKIYYLFVSSGIALYNFTVYNGVPIYPSNHHSHKNANFPNNITAIIHFKSILMESPYVDHLESHRTILMSSPKTHVGNSYSNLTERLADASCGSFL